MSRTGDTWDTMRPMCEMPLSVKSSKRPSAGRIFAKSSCEKTTRPEAYELMFVIVSCRTEPISRGASRCSAGAEEEEEGTAPPEALAAPPAPASCWSLISTTSPLRLREGLQQHQQSPARWACKP